MTHAETVHFRHNQAILVAAVIALIGALPLGCYRWYLAPVLLVPLAVVLWAWRSGTDADRTGLRLRSPVGQRHIPWSDVVELAGDERGRAVARLRGDRLTLLPAVRVTDLPRLVAASGQPLPATTTVDPDEK